TFRAPDRELSVDELRPLPHASQPEVSRATSATQDARVHSLAIVADAHPHLAVVLADLDLDLLRLRVAERVARLPCVDPSIVGAAARRLSSPITGAGGGSARWPSVGGAPRRARTA